jgi:membrane protease YdiL (CAAX protease family)
MIGLRRRRSLRLSGTRRLGDRALARPVAFAIALIIAWWVVTLLLATVLPRLSLSWFPDLRSTLVNLGALLVPLGVVVAFGWWRQAGLALPRPDRSWWTLAPLLFFALSFAAGGLSGSAALFFGSAVLFLALGLNEELLFRGVIQHALGTLGAVSSVVWVGLLFGLQHAFTVIFFGASLYEAGSMVISSSASGAAYAAVRLRIGTIWPLAFLHGLENFCNTRSPGDAPWWWYLSEAIFFVLYAAWLLRRSRAA